MYVSWSGFISSRTATGIYNTGGNSRQSRFSAVVGHRLFPVRYVATHSARAERSRRRCILNPTGYRAREREREEEQPGQRGGVKKGQKSVSMTSIGKGSCRATRREPRDPTDQPSSLFTSSTLATAKVSLPGFSSPLDSPHHHHLFLFFRLLLLLLSSSTPFCISRRAVVVRSLERTAKVRAYMRARDGGIRGIRARQLAARQAGYLQPSWINFKRERQFGNYSALAASRSSSSSSSSRLLRLAFNDADETAVDTSVRRQLGRLRKFFATSG